MVDPNQVRSIVEEAMRRPAAERAAFVEGAIGRDEALQVRVQEMLAATDQSISGGSAGGSTAAPTAHYSGASPQSRSEWIGPYRLLQQIGEGGMGIVYMAEQTKPVQRLVAMKIIKPGMDSQQVIARFEAERQALAMMDHANIARVLDAGTTDDGRPYFVMDLVKGFPITDYCDEQHLPLHERLVLMTTVCEAIQHAHQKGIIHRDLKPSNVLVAEYDGKPVVKVIDFGVAKATAQKLTERTMFTEFGQVIGTVDYMSPEQARFNQLDIDTRSDVYSLGVILYELLTGLPPFDRQRMRSAAFDEVLRIIREDDPPKPSTRLTASQTMPAAAAKRQTEPLKLKRALKGELDWIVMRALEKDRHRRYQSASALAEDLQRYLHDQPVTASPATRSYRLKKFVQRNRVESLAIATVAASLIVGAGASLLMYVREREARTAAETARVEADNARREESILREQAEARAELARLARMISDGESEAADRLVERLPTTIAQPFTDAANSVRTLAELHVLRNDLPTAARRFKLLMQLNRADSASSATLDSIRYAAVLAALGDKADFDVFRQKLISDMDRIANALVAERIMKAALILPAESPTVEALLPFYAVASSDQPWAWGCVSLALMALRQNHYEKCLEWCQKGADAQYPYGEKVRAATIHTIRSMAYHRLRRDELSKSELALARQIITEALPMADLGSLSDGPWYDWMIARQLYREAVQERPQEPDLRLPDGPLVRLRPLAPAGEGTTSTDPRSNAAEFADPLDVNQLQQHLGKVVKAKGRIVRFSSTVTGTAHYLSFTHDPHDGLTLVCFPNRDPAFRPEILRSYVNKTVVVEGKLGLFRESIQIIVDSPAMITIQDANSPDQK